MAGMFEAGKIGRLEIKNRLVRSATCEWMCDADGRAGASLVDLYSALGRGGVGLIITGHAYVTRTGRASPGQIGLYTDELGEALRPVAEAAHSAGSKIVVQINHAGMAARPQLNDNAVAMAPSAPPTGSELPPVHEMTDAQVREVAAAYGQAAGRVQAAGFDGVQIHGAHGYLISQFISPFTNRRTDRWGGSFDNRLNFVRAVCEEVRGRVGADFPLLIKLASQDFVADGLEARDAARIAARLPEFGIEAIEISGGVQMGRKQNNVRPGIREQADEAYFMDNALRFRDATNVPLILVGGFRTPSVIQRALDAGMDFVSLCRPLINNPDIPNEWAAGSDRPSGCVSCNACLDRRTQPLRCYCADKEGRPQKVEP